MQNGGEDTVPIGNQRVTRSHRHDHLGDAEQAPVDVDALLPGHALVGRPPYPLRSRQIHNIHPRVLGAIPHMDRHNGMGSGAIGVHGRGPDFAIAGAQLEEALQVVLAGQDEAGAVLAARRHHGQVGRVAQQVVGLLVVDLDEGGGHLDGRLVVLLLAVEALQDVLQAAG